MFLLAISIGCTSDTSTSPDSGSHSTPPLDSAETGGAPDPTVPEPPVPMVSEVLADCEEAGVFSGLAAGTEFEKHELDLTRFPNALCNDGTPGVLYFRPAPPEGQRDRWLIQMSGGGTCSDGDDCARRWCSVSTNNGAYDMSTKYGPAGSRGTGVLEPQPAAGANDYADANLVFLRYCTSDFWMGTLRDQVLDGHHPVTDEAIRYRIHFLGSEMLFAMVDALRQDGVPALVHSDGTALPDLDDAADVVFAGSMAGGEGLTVQLDRLRAHLESHQTTGALRVAGLMDSAFSPALDGLDYSVSTFCADRVPKDERICSYQELIEGLRIPIDTLYGAIGEDSCTAWHAAHAPETEWQCHDQGHLVRHHVTTPLMVRQGLTDGHRSEHYVNSSQFGIDGVPMTLADFANLTRAQLEALGSLASTAEEGADLIAAPGVFGPHCSTTDTLTDTTQTFQTVIASNGDQRLFDVLARWRDGGADPIVVSQDPTDSTCP